MRVPRPVRRGLPQLLGEGRVAFLHDFGRRGEEPLHHSPHPPRGDPTSILQDCQSGSMDATSKASGQPR